ncbi:prefoldin subunit alpha [Candidatus Pacearchaeota archaeon]|nr:prefoldin subunit alpha [Candidatus Pacearchaeota archaeon]
MDERLLAEASALEQYTQDLEQHYQMIVQQLKELDDFYNQIEEILPAKDQQILAPIGKGVYVKTYFSDEKFFVNIGAGVIIKKNREQLKKTIEDQRKKLHESRTHILGQLEFYADKLNTIMHALQDTMKV